MEVPRSRAGAGFGQRRELAGHSACRYNALIALYLAYLGTIGHLEGLLLWPGVAVHAVVALLLVWVWRGERRTQTSNM